MPALSLILIPLGLAAEALAGWLLLTGGAASSGLLAPLMVHLIAAATVTLGVYFALPMAYRRPCAGAFAFIGSSAVLIPGLGPLGLVLALLPGLYWAHREETSEWDRLEMPDLPFQPVSVDPDDVFIRDGLSSVLMHFDDRNRRQQAITACRHLPRREAVPILRSALGDAADEVRLLAYAMINAIERDLEGQLNAVRDMIAASGDPDGELHEERAELFWEFSYLRLALGSVEELMLEKALVAVDIAIARQSTAHRWLLSARICLALGRYNEAEDALICADGLGLDVDDGAPRWAELAFCRGQFSAVAPALRRLSGRGAANPVMRPVLEYWL